MDHKRENEKASESKTEQSSPKGQGAYYSREPKRPKNVFSAFAVVGFIAMFLAGTGYFASKKMVTDPEQTEVSRQLEIKKELITSVLALQDDDYDSNAEKIPNKVQVPTPENTNTSDKKITEVTLDPQVAGPEAAPNAEAVAQTPEEDLRATEEAQRNQLAADSASMQTLTDEAVAREARAEEAIRKHKESHLKLLQSYQNQTIKVGGVPQSPVQAQLGLYRGILSKCYIHGHDVHWIDDSGSIIDHVELDTPLPGSAAIARNMIYEMGGGVAVIVYEKGYEVYSSSGELIKAGKYEEHGL